MKRSDLLKQVHEAIIAEQYVKARRLLGLLDMDRETFELWKLIREKVR